MYNYYASIVFKADLILLGAAGMFSFLTVFIAAIKEWRWRSRAKALFELKKNVYSLGLSGQALSPATCLPFASAMTIRQFLDAETNRNRDAIFFNDDEQEILRACFASPPRIKQIAHRAKLSWNKWRRIEALLALGYAHADSELATLEKSLYDKDDDVSYFSLLALGQIRMASSARILLGFLKDRKFYRYKIVSILESFPPEIAKDVVSVLDDSDPVARVWLLELLSNLNGAPYFKEIEKMLADPQEDIRAAACGYIGRIGNKGAEQALAGCLKDESWKVRSYAVKALSDLLGDKAIPRVIGRINDPSITVLDTIKDVMNKYIETAMPYIDDFLYSDDAIAKRISLEVLGYSGYAVRFVGKMVDGNEKERARAEHTIKGILIAGGHADIEGALMILSEEKRRKALDIIRRLDENMAGTIERNLEGYKKVL